MLNLKEEMAEVKVGPATVFAGLAVFPLVRKNPLARDYLTLNEAFLEDGVEISEVSEGGSVPELRLKNNLDKDVFAADGEALMGAKQNRVLNTSIFVNAKSEVVVPVSCVEQGRWAYRQRNFRECDYSEFVNSRAAKVASVGASLKASGWDRHSDQGEVWRQVDAKRSQFGAYAPTGSMSDVYEARRPRLDQYVQIFRVQPDQAGLACSIDGSIAGIELFEDTSVFSQYASKLIRAYASEVLGKDSMAAAVPDRMSVRSLLRRISKLDIDEYPAVGSGTELRFSANGLNGSALAVNDRLLHMVMLRKTNGLSY